jgi:ribonucleoside-diphosphate reductase alpha chain
MSKTVNYSALRKKLQKEGEIPEWFTTAGCQLFYEKYSYENETVKSRFLSIAKAMAQHAPVVYPDWWEEDTYTQGKNWEEVFFNTMWDGFISCSTPMLANAGLRKRGTTVSCAGGVVGNNLYDRYNAITEASVLTKHSHGTSYSIDEWPHEGAPLPRGGNSLGTPPLIRDMINAMNEVTQGSRRGSLAYSIRPQHGDFDWVLQHLHENTESNNVGWLIDDEFVEGWNNKDKETTTKIGKMLKVKLIRGKGYFTFIDKCNRKIAEAFKRLGLKMRASNLCQETLLPADHKYTFSCVILNYNLELYKQWPKHLVFLGQVMSDCNVTEYLQTIDEMSYHDQQAMKKIRQFTEDFRALGSGVLGWHTLMQKESIVIGSLQCMWLDDEIFSGIDKQSKEATEWLAKVLGEPEGCKGLGIRNATRLMMPPTKSTAEIMAGASEGIGLDTAMVFTKQSAGGELFRINKILLGIMKERGVYNDETIMRIAKNRSVRGEEWLSEHEQQVFRTAFEISMEDFLRLCSKRAKYIDQMQSINLYFTSNDSEQYISKIHKIAFNDPEIYSLYYIYSMRGAGNLKRDECAACM